MMVLTAMYAGLSLSVGRLLACNWSNISAVLFAKEGSRGGEDLGWKSLIRQAGRYLMVYFCPEEDE